MRGSIIRNYLRCPLGAILAVIMLGLTGCGDGTPGGPDYDGTREFFSKPEGFIVEAIGVNSKGHVLAGTATGRLHISTDSGNSWALTSLTDTGLVALAMNANDDIFVSFHHYPTAGIGEGKIYRSVDDGESWVRLALEHTICWDFAFGPGGAVFAATSPALFGSADNGDSWERTDLDAANVEVVALNDSGHIFAGEFSGVRGHFWRSLDGGVSWQDLGLGNDYRSIVVDSRGVIYVGHPWHDESGGGISRSADNGDTWTGPGMYHRALHDHGIWGLALLPNDGILAATAFPSFDNTEPAGLYASLDDGDSWTLLLADSLTAVGTSSSGTIYVGTLRGNVFRSTDGGNSWD